MKQVQLVIDLASDRAGWSETYVLPYADPQAAIGIAATLCQLRLNILATNLWINWGRLSMQGAPPDAVRVPGFTNEQFGRAKINPRTDASGADCNIEQESIHMAFINDDGRQCNRYLRGVPDAWIRGNFLTDSGIADIDILQADPVVTYLTPNPNWSAKNAVMNYMYCVVKETESSSPVKDADGVVVHPKDFTNTAYARAYVVRANSKNVGRPFGPFRGRRSRKKAAT